MVFLGGHVADGGALRRGADPMVDAVLEARAGVVPFVTFGFFAGEEGLDFLCAGYGGFRSGGRIFWLLFTEISEV